MSYWQPAQDRNAELSKVLAQQIEDAGRWLEVAFLELADRYAPHLSKMSATPQHQQYPIRQARRHFDRFNE